MFFADSSIKEGFEIIKKLESLEISRLPKAEE
jgi:hypothetical protein